MTRDIAAIRASLDEQVAALVPPDAVVAPTQVGIVRGADTLSDDIAARCQRWRAQHPGRARALRCYVALRESTGRIRDRIAKGFVDVMVTPWIAEMCIRHENEILAVVLTDPPLQEDAR